MTGMQYRLRTLLVLVGFCPPAIGALWHAWYFLLLVAAVVVLLSLWYAVSWFLRGSLASWLPR
jgi:hypothetical protein